MNVTPPETTHTIERARIGRAGFVGIQPPLTIDENAELFDFLDQDYDERQGDVRTVSPDSDTGDPYTQIDFSIDMPGDEGYADVVVEKIQMYMTKLGYVAVELNTELKQLQPGQRLFALAA